MNFIGNILWLIFGGLATFIEYIISGTILCLSIIGIPFGLQCYKLAVLALWPFGQKLVDSEPKRGCLYGVMNFIWFFVGGIWIFFTHIFFAILLFITIIGAPFAMQHLKMAKLALVPFGKTIA